MGMAISKAQMAQRAQEAVQKASSLGGHVASALPSHMSRFQGSPVWKAMENKVRAAQAAVARREAEASETGGESFQRKWDTLGEALKNNNRALLQAVVPKFSSEERALAEKLLGGGKPIEQDANPFVHLKANKHGKALMKEWQNADIWEDWSKLPKSLDQGERAKLNNAYTPLQSTPRNRNRGGRTIQGTGADVVGRFVPEKFMKLAQKYRPASATPPASAPRLPQRNQQVRPQVPTAQMGRPTAQVGRARGGLLSQGAPQRPQLQGAPRPTASGPSRSTLGGGRRGGLGAQGPSRGLLR